MATIGAAFGYFVFHPLIHIISLTHFFGDRGISTDLLSDILNAFSISMLPICASCKQIRDDRGHWNEIEVYIEKHSEAEFSHGICPECARKLYPEYFSERPSSED